MGWVKRWQSKNIVVDPKNPSALGVCDDSGFVFNHKNLVKQMEWRGDNYVWTGLMKGPQYIDKPQEQNRPPLVKNDPRPVMNPRPPTPYTDPEYPVVDPFPEIIAELETESFYDDNQAPYGPPSYVLPYSNTPTPGWNDPDPVPPYPQLLAKLNKISWNW